MNRTNHVSHLIGEKDCVLDGESSFPVARKLLISALVARSFRTGTALAWYVSRRLQGA
jgi:hypothetical protein